MSDAEPGSRTVRSAAAGPDGMATDPPTPAAEPSPTLLQRLGSAGASVASIEPSHPRLKLALRVAVVVLVAAFVGFAIASQWGQLPEVEWRFAIGWVGASIVGFLAMLVMHATGWRLIVAAMGFPMDHARARAIWAKSVLARYVPTNALMVVGRVNMAAREGVPQRVALASIVYEIALQVAAAVAVGAYFVLSLDSLAGEPLRFLILLVPALALAGLHPAIFHPLTDMALTRLGRERLPVSLPFSRVLGMWAFYALSFLVAGLALLAFTYAVYPVATEDIPSLIAAWGVGFTVSVLAFVFPAGLGARELGLATALAPAVPSAVVAAAIAVASRIVVTGVELLFAGIASLLARRSR